MTTLSDRNIWLYITQFNLYLNRPGRAEKLRETCVAHSGQKRLVVTAFGNRYNVDFGELPEETTHLIDEDLADPTLRQWIVPDFTTTTQLTGSRWQPSASI